ncbi:phosphopantetheine-binding protein [Kitasatospora sp. NBC_00374]|uniref:phosphopantetheine-binding protein n=1 Tax=Kitasatospora sp. NBC_00374 TaxID=2975964 RepID=UPI0030DF1324
MKIRGLRVDTPLVEAMLVRAPGVKLAAAVLRDDSRGGQRLVAYVVPQPGVELDPVALRAFVGDRLPDRYVPSAVVPLASFPLTGNGKLCRSRLPEPAYGPVAGSRRPRTEGEERLCALFAEVLAADEPGIDDNFFDLGGDEAAAARLFGRISAELGRSVDAEMLAGTPTVAGLAQSLDIGKPVRAPIPPSRWRSKIKIDGYQLAPCEVAATLTAAPGVRHAAIGVREDQPGKRRLVGYVVPEPDEALEPEQVQAYLVENLPPYMVPSALVVLDALPMTRDGILDRPALPAPDRDGGLADMRPRSRGQEQLSRLFAEVLGVPEVRLDESFFELGGHSLLAIRLTNRIRVEFGVEMETQTVFEAPTVTELARRIETAKPARPKAAAS